jgi:hypothetical protein
MLPAAVVIISHIDEPPPVTGPIRCIAPPDPDRVTAVGGGNKRPPFRFAGDEPCSVGRKGGPEIIPVAQGIDEQFDSSAEEGDLRVLDSENRDGSRFPVSGIHTLQLTADGKYNIGPDKDRNGDRCPGGENGRGTAGDIPDDRLLENLAGERSREHAAIGDTGPVIGNAEAAA